MTEETATAGSPRKPTEKEAFFFLTILNCMKNKPEVDWDLVATRAGYSNAACAKVRYGQIKRQIGFKEDGSIAVPTPTKSRAQKPVGSGTNTTPSKVAKKKPTPRKPKATKSEAMVKPEDEDQDAEEVFKGEVDDAGVGDGLGYRQAHSHVYGGYKNGDDDGGKPFEGYE